MKKVLRFIYGLLSIIVIVIFSIALFALIEWIQGELFVPKSYIMWVVKYPASRFVFIYVIYLFFGYYYIFKMDFREAFLSFYKRKRRIFVSAFLAINIVLLYAILVNVTVITKDKLIDYSFLTPQGRKYNYKDIVKIVTGVYGEKQLFGHSKGDFYYIVELKDGKKIDLANDIGAAKTDIDERFLLEKLDRKLVSMGIPKKSSMANFKYATKSLAKIYTDKIKIILKRKTPYD